MAEDSLKELAESADSGGRAPEGLTARLLFSLALLWSAFQLWYASPLPFTFNILNLDFTEARAVHLSFALLLAFLAFPALARSPRHRVPLYDWVLALVAASATAYVFVFQPELQSRPGAPIAQDIVVGVIGIVLLLEATRRAVGVPLVVIGVVFLSYGFLGPWMPAVIAHKGASLAKTVSHQWLTSEGVFGVALGVSTNFVFLFVLFGALLDRAGAGAWFIRVSYAGLGHLRGGPAKAAVVSSGLTGLVSGSSIANVVTTGTFTIPLMKRVGFPATKAGAIEVAASVDGQIMPPVMGAAAFLMVEYVGIPYTDVIRHAFLPAVLSYGALFYIVHLEALKMGLTGVARPHPGGLRVRLVRWGLAALVLALVAAAVYWGLGWTRAVLGGGVLWVGSGVLAVAYLVLLRLAARNPAPDDDLLSGTLPPMWPTLRSGLHYLIPVVVLMWCLMVERLSPALSAFWAIMFLGAIMLTHRPLTRLFRGESGGLGGAFLGGVREVIEGMVGGARNMTGIALATAAAGIVVGTVTLTGLGLVMTDLVELISGGNLMLMLLFTAMISLVLGMGLPTTANYIVVATLMAPVVVTLAAQGGLLVPLIAVHMFVFYFGLMADVTPPVGLATFAASAISGADPARTGLQAFLYSARTIILPFMFIFNPQLLLIGITDPFHLFVTIAGALVAMLTFAAAAMGWFLVRSRWYETAALFLVAFILFRPGFFWDMAFDPYDERPASALQRVVAAVPDDGFLRINVTGETVLGEPTSRALALRLATKKDAAGRLHDAGLELTHVGNEVRVLSVAFGSAAERTGLRAGWRITSVLVPADRPAKEWMFVPALLLLGGVVALQRPRRVASKAPAN